MTARITTLLYGAVAYLAFVASLVYTIGFLAGAGVPKGVDDGPHERWVIALLIDAGLLSLFAVQHSVMARPWFKRWWTRITPPASERSTYVLASSAVVGLLLWQWRPLPHQVWSIEATWLRDVVWAGYALGWGVLLASTIQIGHFDLFGLKQVLARARDRTYQEPGFRMPFLYRLVRHPLLVGFLIAFWCAPTASVGRLLFAAAASGYIFVAVHFEEHDLRTQLGDDYVRYAEQVPRFVPKLSSKVTGRVAAATRPQPH